jgi:hypothetical protein
MAILTTAVKQYLVGYKAEFLAAKPNTRFDDDDNLVYTDSEWLDHVVKEFLVKISKKGERKIKEGNIVINDYSDIDA